MSPRIASIQLIRGCTWFGSPHGSHCLVLAQAIWPATTHLPQTESTRRPSYRRQRQSSRGGQSMRGSRSFLLRDAQGLLAGTTPRLGLDVPAQHGGRQTGELLVQLFRLGVDERVGLGLDLLDAVS